MSATTVAESAAVILLISGSIEGRLDELYKRCSRIQRKASQQFSILFCVGEFFGPQSGCGPETIGRYTRGEAKAPLPTYIVSPLPEWASELVPDPVGGCELGPGLVYLGRRGVFSGQTGLKVAYLSGIGRGDGPRHYSDSDLAWLSNQAGKATGDSEEFPGVDLLLTCAWPAGALNGCDWLPLDEREAIEAASRPFAQPAAARLAVLLRPRYHVCACGGGEGGLDFERRPYRNHRVASERERHVTRFHSLAGLASGRRCLYALQLQPLARLSRVELLAQQPTGAAAVTDCPYETALSAGTDGADEFGGTSSGGQPRSFFFAERQSRGRGRGGGGGDRRSGQKRVHLDFSGGGGAGESKRTQAVYPASACWFCLGNPDVQRHLVVSVAKATYLALPRGPLVPWHVIALPIGHVKCFSDCPPEVTAELARYKRCLAQLYAASECAPVYIERNFKNHHAQLQCIPVPVSSLPSLKAAFKDIADKHEPRLVLQELHPDTQLSDLVPGSAAYFCVDLPAGERLFCRIKPEEFKSFPLSFGRDVLASHHVYDCPDRVDWRECLESQEVETASAVAFKKAFAPFDFSIKVGEDDD